METRPFKRVAVLKGGPSEEREVSLRSGAAVARGLAEAGYDVTEVDVQTESVVLPPGTEAAFVVLHGRFGEDGAVQEILRGMGVPYTGSGPRSSRDAFDKRTTKRILAEHGLPTPAWEVLAAGQPRTLPLPVVVKPPCQGSTIGISRVFEESGWPAAFLTALEFDPQVLVEAYIEGRELTVGIVCDEVLPVVEIVAPDGYYDYRAKYTRGQSRYVVPAALTPAETAACRDLARRVYEALDARGLARVDIRLTPDGRPYVLELNSIPGFTETSLLPMAAAAAGLGFSALCDRILRSASVH
jgi:D-alanine-D-alanine ligase